MTHWRLVTEEARLRLSLRVWNSAILAMRGPAHLARCLRSSSVISGSHDTPGTSAPTQDGAFQMWLPMIIVLASIFTGESLSCKAPEALCTCVVAALVVRHWDWTSLRPNCGAIATSGRAGPRRRWKRHDGPRNAVAHGELSWR